MFVIIVTYIFSTFINDTGDKIKHQYFYKQFIQIPF